jgi:hypothetical protein
MVVAGTDLTHLEVDILAPDLFSEIGQLTESQGMPEGEDLRRWIDSPIEGLRRDIRRDVKEQFDEIRRELRDHREAQSRDSREYRDGLKQSLDERLGRIEKSLGGLEEGKASKRVEHILYGLCGLIIVYVVNLWLGAIELNREPTPDNPPSAAQKR